MSPFNFIQNKTVNNIAVAFIVGSAVFNFVQTMSYMVLPRYFNGTYVDNTSSYNWKDVAMQATILVVAMVFAWIVSIFAKEQ